MDTKLVRMSMDGTKSTRTTIKTLKGTVAHMILTLDVINQHLYWSYHTPFVFTQGNKVIKMTYDGETLFHFDPYTFTTHLNILNNRIVRSGYEMFSYNVIWDCENLAITSCRKLCHVDGFVNEMQPYPFELPIYGKYGEFLFILKYILSFTLFS